MPDSELEHYERMFKKIKPTFGDMDYVTAYCTLLKLQKKSTKARDSNEKKFIYLVDKLIDKDGRQ